MSTFQKFSLISHILRSN